MNKEVEKLSVAAMNAAVNHLKTCEAGMIHHPFKSRSLPMLEAALAEIAKGDSGASMGRDVAKKLIQFITVNMERESAFLQPNPQVFMNDAYGLLDLIKNEAKLKPEEVDAWMVEAQPKKSTRPRKA